MKANHNKPLCGMKKQTVVVNISKSKNESKSQLYTERKDGVMVVVNISKYSNYNGTFRYNEMKLKGFTYESRDRGYRYFLAQNPDIKDRQLYRTFTLDPWRFWDWNEWFKHFDRFTLPYISEKKIQKNRELEGLNK